MEKIKRGLKLKIDMSSETRLCRYIAIVILFVFLTNILSGLESVIGLSSSLVSIVLKMLLGMLFISELPTVVKRLNKHLIILMLCAFIVILANFLFFPHLNNYFEDTVFTFMSFCLVTYIVCYQIENYTLLVKEITRISYVVVLMVFLFLAGMFSGLIPSFNSDKYSMGLGYSCVVPALFLLIDFTKNKRIISIIGFFIFIIAIISFASRGPLLELLAFFVFFPTKYFFEQKKYIRGLLIVVAFVLAVLFYKEILLMFSNYLQHQGMQSRVIRTLTTEHIYMSGRDLLYEKLVPEVFENPFAVRGINAEWDVIGVYAHNFVIEVLFQFGIVIGGIIVVFIIGRAIHTALLTDFNSQKIICIAFMFACFPQLFVSSSLWINSTFWMWMAVFSKLTYNQKNKDSVFQGL